MSYQDTISEINARRGQMMKLRAEMRDLQATIEPQIVSDYSFDTPAGPRTLSSYFGDKDTLFVIHNMGKSCVSCTQWADGFNGVLNHLQDRAAFIVSSPDSVDIQQEFAAGRGWNFQMVSHINSTFAKDMGYSPEENGQPKFWPGVSVFQMKQNAIVRVSDTSFGPGDDFNAIWNFFSMIPEGVNGWKTKYRYDS